MTTRPPTAPWRTRSLLAVALVLGSASLASVVWARPEVSAQGPAADATRARELVHVTPTLELSRRYGLEVVEVAPPPVFAAPAPANAAPTVSTTAGCPVRVTAIVEAEDASLSFAILVGADGASTLASRGQRLRTSRGEARVEAIESSGVRLGIGAEDLHCAFYRTGQ